MEATLVCTVQINRTNTYICTFYIHIFELSLYRATQLHIDAHIHKQFFTFSLAFSVYVYVSFCFSLAYRYTTAINVLFVLFNCSDFREEQWDWVCGIISGEHSYGLQTFHKVSNQKWDCHSPFDVRLQHSQHTRKMKTKQKKPSSCLNFGYKNTINTSSSSDFT